MKMIFWIKVSVASTIATILMSGCVSKENMSTPEIINTSKNMQSNNTFCVSSPTKISVLMETASKAFNKQYIYDGEECKNEKIFFNHRECFSSIDELYKFINSYTDYKFYINTKNTRGIEVKNLTVKSAFDYINSRGNAKKVVLLDGDMILKNKYNFYIKTLDGLEKYIVETTPFYLYRITNTEKKAVYILRYKYTNKNIGDAKALLINLQEAKKLIVNAKDVKIAKRKKIAKRLDEIISGVKDYEQNK